ncbi:hypothetical protein BDN67DRAFT_908075 [Paxillus ammoniavirescens]|nr:hypothetical protein BDN67DRAFT_908075 [Paxillus ammoniavirescens]
MVPSTDSEGPMTRRDDHLKQAKQCLFKWHYKTWLDMYSDAVPYGPLGLLLDVVIEKIATRWLKQVAKLLTGGIGWSVSRTHQHSEEVLKMLGELDEKMDSEKKLAQIQRAEAKKHEMAE